MLVVLVNVADRVVPERDGGRSVQKEKMLLDTN